MCGPASRASLPFFFLPRRKEGRVAGCLGREGGREAKTRDSGWRRRGGGGGERCPLLPPPPPPPAPLFEFKCFCVHVSFISPDEHISSKWMLTFQPIDGYCFFCFFYQPAMLCLCADARIVTIFLFHGIALHPSIKA